MVNKKDNGDFILGLVLCIYLAELIFPRINFILNPTYVRLICLGIWLVLSFCKNPEYYCSIRPIVLSSLLYFLVTIIIPYLFGYSVIGNRYMALAMLPFSYVIYDYYSYNGKIHQLKIILVFMYFLAAITAVTTLKALLENPFISRSIKSEGEISASLARQGIGGYHFIYFTVVSSIIFLFILLESKKKKIKLLAVVMYLFSMFLVLSSNYMTALVIAIGGSVVFLISRAARKKNLGPALVLSVGLILLCININTIVASFSDFIPARIGRVVITNSDENVFQAVYEEFTRDRGPVLSDSLSAFKENFLFGMVGNQTLTYRDGALAGLGQHSHILDTFAFYGIGIGIWNVFIILFPFVDKERQRKAIAMPLENAVMFCVLCLYLFNNATDSIAIVAGIVMPTMREMYNDETEELTESSYEKGELF